jgi:hypothetical protein
VRRFAESDASTQGRTMISTHVNKRGHDPVGRLRWLALIDALGAALMTVGIFLWPIYIGDAAHESAVRAYGYDVDSGAMAGYAAFNVALIFFAPSAMLLTAASVSMWKRGRRRGLLQVLAILSLIVPAILVVRFAQLK